MYCESYTETNGRQEATQKIVLLITVAKMIKMWADSHTKKKKWKKLS